MSPKKIFIAVIYLILSVLLLAKSDCNNTTQRFQENDGLIRAIECGIYKYYSVSGELQLVLDEFTYADDFNDGVAIVKGSGLRSYGAIDKKGRLIVDTIWSDMKPSISGYLLASKKVQGYVVQDRGFGQMQYPKESWHFIQSTTGNVLDEISFKVIVNLNGYASGEDHDGNTYFINVQKLNPGLFDPFMKSIIQINGRSVFTFLNNRNKTISYLYDDSRKLALTYAYNQDPFSKYRFEWSGDLAKLDLDD